MSSQQQFIDAKENSAGIESKTQRSQHSLKQRINVNGMKFWRSLKTRVRAFPLTALGCAALAISPFAYTLWSRTKVTDLDMELKKTASNVWQRMTEEGGITEHFLYEFADSHPKIGLSHKNIEEFWDVLDPEGTGFVQRQRFEETFVENFQYRNLQIWHEIQRHPVIPILIVTTFGVNVQLWGLANMAHIKPSTLRLTNMCGVGSSLVKGIVLVGLAMKQHREIHKKENKFFYFLEEEYNPDAMDKKRMRETIGKSVNLSAEKVREMLGVNDASVEKIVPKT